MRPINFAWYDARPMKLELGDDLRVITYGWKCRDRCNCRFVKVTRKGFHIVDLDTNRMIFKNHLYAKGMAGKEFPSRGSIKGVFKIPAWANVTVQSKSQKKVS